ncbi:bolA-like protein 1 isoform X1 [Danio rerio]|uniref:BolA-like protein 1 isoform X1 n=1 Tax=Danio rerio TaxID=7955 RepID=A0AC58HG87_DANRE
MLSSALRCLRPISSTLVLSRPLAHHMDPSVPRPVETTIRTKLSKALNPEHLEVINESHMHAVPPGSESHFKVLVAKTPQQWSSNPSLAKSPPCMGGSRHDHTMAEKLKAGRD